MSKEFSTIEDLFKASFNEHSVEPAPEVLSGLKQKLFWSDFFSFNMRKLNITYATLAVATLISLPFIMHSSPTVIVPVSEISPATTYAQPLVEPEVSVPESAPIAVSGKTNTPIEEAPIAETIEEVMVKAHFIINTATACAPFEAKFLNTSTNFHKINWDFDDGKQSTELNPQHTFKRAGKYTVRLEITNKNGKTDSYSKEIVVHAPPVAGLDIDIENSDIEVKAISFKNLSENAVKYKWLFGDNNESEEEVPVHSYNDYGIYNVSVICTAENGCTDTAKLVNKFIDKNYKLAFPLTFRPNPNDAQNKGYYQSANQQASVFYPENYGAKSYQLDIYTLNGIKMFSTSNIKQGWNGFIRGRMAPAGTYRFEAKGIYPNNKPFHVTGNFKVIIDKAYYDYY